MNRHARLSPSSAYRWSECPGSVHLIESLAESDQFVSEITHDNEYIKFGVEAHAVAENILRDNSATITADEEIMAVVQPYVDYVGKRVWGEGRTLLVEHRVSLSSLNPPEPIYGTADAIIWDPLSLEVVDLKTGQGVKVDPLENPQLIL